MNSSRIRKNENLSGATESPMYIQILFLISLSLKDLHDLTNIQDVAVVTEKDCRGLLLKRPGFTRSGDGRLVYGDKVLN